MANRLERAASGWKSLPLRERVAHSEIDTWYSSCSRLMDTTFGKNSAETIAWASSLAQFDKIQANQIRVGEDFLLMTAERIVCSIGILRQLEAQRLATTMQISQLFVPAYRALEAEKNLSEAQKREIRDLVKSLQDEMSRPTVDQHRLGQILSLLKQNAGWIVPIIGEIVKIRLGL